MSWKKLKEVKEAQRSQAGEQHLDRSSYFSCVGTCCKHSGDINKPSLYLKLKDDTKAKRMMSDIDADFWKQRGAGKLPSNAQLVSGT